MIFAGSFRPTRVVRLRPVLVFIILAGALPAPSAISHELVEQRQLILSVSPEGVELLVVYELPAGAPAARLRLWMDLDKDGTTSNDGLEALARAQLLVPRLISGIDVVLDGAPVQLALAEVSFTDGAGSGEEMGFVGMAIYAWSSPDPIATSTVELRVSEDTPSVLAHVQTTGPLTIAASTVPRAPDAPVVGPVNVLHEVPLQVTVAPSE